MDNKIIIVARATTVFITVLLASIALCARAQQTDHRVENYPNGRKSATYIRRLNNDGHFPHAFSDRCTRQCNKKNTDNPTLILLSVTLLVCKSEQVALRVLGYSKVSWDNESGSEQMPWSYIKSWASLTVKEKFAAVILGYTKVSWDNESGSVPQPPSAEKRWDEMSKCSNGEDLSYTEPLPVSPKRIVYIYAKKSKCATNVSCLLRYVDKTLSSVFYHLHFVVATFACVDSIFVPEAPAKPPALGNFISVSVLTSWLSYFQNAKHQRLRQNANASCPYILDETPCPSQMNAYIEP